MYKDLKFPVLIVHRDIKADTVAGERVRGIAHELEQDGFSILSTASSAEGRIVASTHHGLACILVAAEGAGENQRLLQDVVELIRVARVRAPQLPIFALGEQVTIENAPAESMADLHQLRGILYLFEDTVPFLARQVARAARNYLAGLLPPFFRALVEHTAQSNYSWHTPGHGGGVAYRKSPVGQAFHQFFGRTRCVPTCRSRSPSWDRCSTIPAPGRGRGPCRAQFRRRPYLLRDQWHFHREQDRLALHGRSRRPGAGGPQLPQVDPPLDHHDRGDTALPDSGTQRTGDHRADPLSEFSKESIAAKIAASPLARGREPKVKLAVVTNSTYDGLCYNAELIKQTLGDSVEVLHFDEAWYAYAAFHEFYDGRYGMGTSRSEEGPLVFATHSTHKMLAAFSQASMIHVQDGGTRKLDVARFNEAFMMHISTSPQYGIIASLDVASAMMEGPAGRSLIQETFDEALSFRRALANVRQNLDRNDWWFGVWQPEQVEGTDQVGTHDWLEPSADWHGFGDIAEDYVLLDPIKVTLTTPGLSAGGKLSEQGIPAAIVSRFLWERGLVVEKTGLYSFLVLFSMGITKGKWSTLVTELLEFKRCYDANLPLLDVLPSVAQAGGKRYNGVGLRDLSDAMHASYRDNATAKAMKRMYTVLPEVAMRPSEAYDKLVRGEVEAVPIARLEGRIAAVMLVPYPPGIPLIMPGERFTEATRSILDYLEFARTFERAFPGFDSDVHGLQHQDGPSGRCYTVECIKE